MKKLITAATVLFLVPLAAAAQEEEPEQQAPPAAHHPDMAGAHHPGMMEPGRMGGMMMTPEAMPMMAQPGPGMLLRFQTALQLDEDQVARLTTLQDGAREAMQEHMRAAQTARRSAHEALTAEAPDLDAAEQALSEAARHQVQAQMAMARAHLRAAEVLTPEQTERLATIRAAMHEMHGGSGAMQPGHGDGGGEMRRHPPRPQG